MPDRDPESEMSFRSHILPAQKDPNPACNLAGLQWESGFRIRIDLMRIRIRIRIRFFFLLRIRIPDPDPRSGSRV
jgi:hypothetical protein